VKKKNVHRILVGEPERREPLEYLGADERITLKLIFGMGKERALTGLICSEYREVAGCCAHGYEPWDSKKCGNFPNS